MYDQIELVILRSVVADLKVVTNYFLEYFEKQDIQEDSLSLIRLLKNRLFEFSEKLLQVYDGIPEESIFLPKNSGSRLEKLFEKVIQESRQSVTPKNWEKQQQILSEDIAYQKMLTQMRQDYEKKGLVFDEDLLKGNIFHRQQISVVLYQEIITELRQYCEQELLASIYSIIPSINLDSEAQETLEQIKSYLQATKDKKVFL